MKAIVSTTHDDKYLFFLPIVCFMWNKLGVDVICFAPKAKADDFNFLNLIARCGLSERNMVYSFDAPEHKQPTYAQCSRLFAAALDLPKEEVLITSDIDMAVFKVPPHEEMFWTGLTIYGGDLVPPKQFPMCYASATVEDWRNVMKINGRSYQQCLDDLLGEIECEGFRGNMWSKDQEELWNHAHENAIIISRARPGTQFASNRVDRDDANWRSYVNENLFDAHLWRPGYTDENFANILELLKMKYPDENFDWLINYRNEYIKLL